jgi:GT2 family glycosyltransferase
VIDQAAQTAGIPTRQYVALSEQGEGGTRPSNRAMRYAYDRGAHYICYVNDDVRFPQQGWLQALIEAVNISPRYAIAGATGLCSQLPQRQIRPSGKWDIEPIDDLAMFATVIPRRTIDLLGVFDERYTHYADDSDYCKRIQRAGMQALLVHHVWVDHAYHGSTEGIQNEWRKHDQALYYERWGE